jgi:hypothetical protein
VKKLEPYQSLRDVNGVTPSMQEQAQCAAAAYGRVEEDPAPPDAATGLPMPANDATLNWGGGYSMSINPGGPNDNTPFPEDVARVSGRRSSVSPVPQDFGHALTPNEPDGFEDRGSGIGNITGRGR